MLSLFILAAVILGAGAGATTSLEDQARALASDEDITYWPHLL